MAQVVVIGNIASDETLAVEAFPAPGASVAGEAISEALGGKGANQAIVMARALQGVAGVRLVAAIGQDRRGAKLRTDLEAEPLTADLIRRALPSDLSVILRDASRENAIITTQSCARSLTPQEAIAALGTAEVLVLQGNLRAETSLAVLQAAAAQGVLRVLNPSPVEGCSAEMLAHCDLLVVNEGEAAYFGGAEQLSAGKTLVRTLGAAGAELWREGRRIAAVPGRAAQVLDPTGAGDCFLGALVAAMLRRGARAVAASDLTLATWAAGICVSRLATQNAFPTAEEFRAAFAA
ncbi:PfkB family carbohydrate kinase [Pseudogemmobacter faecipullorum]|uniref:Ribokinase n=1 Tax=Pseudogemmobacter faecipullorum TaxID=2755041 RepID=A0ABS8CNB2_9RHOB|nr:PfkB family carbohydrate kinase [Pseudogemmobacter faecipullorum]MCB5410890.1 ribokinase [Pseudogemmobacter faecipullorum]